VNTDDQTPRSELSDEQLDALLDSADQELLDYIQTSIDPTATLAAIMTDSETSTAGQARRSRSVPSLAGRLAAHSHAGPLIRENNDVLVVFNDDQDDDQDQDRSLDLREDEDAEVPTAAATLVISLRPTAFKGIARGTVLRNNRRHPLTAALALITTSMAGIVGAILTMIVHTHALGWFAGLSFTELALAAMGVLLINRRE
jgi:hypothetical protein